MSAARSPESIIDSISVSCIKVASGKICNSKKFHSQPEPASLAARANVRRREDPRRFDGVVTECTGDVIAMGEPASSWAWNFIWLACLNNRGSGGTIIAYP